MLTSVINVGYVNIAVIMDYVRIPVINIGQANILLMNLGHVNICDQYGSC